MTTPEENAALMRAEHAAGRSITANLPVLLTIESTSICNLHCVMCPQGIGAVRRPKHLPEQIVTKLSEATSVASVAQLHGIGEPLASPAFWRLLEGDAFHHDAELSINTNLTLLNDHRLALLLEAKAKLAINISLDAATEQTYRRIRGADFDQVIANIARLRASRGSRKRPVIYMNMTLMRENIEEAPMFVELAHRLNVDAVCFWQLNHWPNKEMARYKSDQEGWHFDYAAQGLWNYPELSDRCVRAAVRRGAELGFAVHLDASKTLFFHEVETTAQTETPVDDETMALQSLSEVEAPAPDVHAAPETVKDCRYPWEWAMITSDGSVRPCCHATAAVGNLNVSSFAEIWNGRYMQTLRRNVKANRIDSVCHGAACKYVQNTVAGDPRERAPWPRPFLRVVSRRWRKK